MLDPSMQSDIITLISSQLTNFQQTSRVQRGLIQSGNFITGSQGWQITAAGDAEFNSGTFRGSLTAASIAIPDNTSANSFHTDSSGNSWWGATTFAAAPASISDTGVAIFKSVTITSPKFFVSTLFESSGRFTLSGHLPTFGDVGLSLATLGTSGSQSVLHWFTSGQTGVNVYYGSPTFTFAVNTFNSANSGIIYVGLGDPSSGGVFTATLNHIGFKIVISAGTTTLYGTQADGTTENATSALTTLLNTDSLDLVAIVNGSTSVAYYWRINGGPLSSAAVATGNVPISGEYIICCLADNQSNANTVACYVSAASYTR